MTTSVITIAIIFSTLLFVLVAAVVGKLIFTHFRRQKLLEGAKENLADEEAMVQSLSQKRRQSLTAATATALAGNAPRRSSVSSSSPGLTRSDSVTSIAGVIVPITRQVSGSRKASVGSFTTSVPASPASVHSHTQTYTQKQSASAPSEQSHRNSISSTPVSAPSKRQSVAASVSNGSVNRRHSKALSQQELAAPHTAQLLSTNAAAALGNGAGAGLKIAIINTAKANRQEERRLAKIERERRRRKRQDSHLKVKEQSKKQTAPKSEDPNAMVQKELEYYTLKGPSRKLRSISSLASSARRRRKNKTRGPVIMEDDEMSTKTGKGLGLVEVSYAEELSEGDNDNHIMAL